MGDFSNIDTSIYWNQAKRYLPDKIDILFVAESPPAFENPDRMYYDPSLAFHSFISLDMESGQVTPYG